MGLVRERGDIGRQAGPATSRLRISAPRVRHLMRSRALAYMLDERRGGGVSSMVT
jgi:hypothetical protein